MFVCTAQKFLSCDCGQLPWPLLEMCNHVGHISGGCTLSWQVSCSAVLVLTLEVPGSKHVCSSAASDRGASSLGDNRSRFCRGDEQQLCAAGYQVWWLLQTLIEGTLPLPLLPTSQLVHRFLV